MIFKASYITKENMKTIPRKIRAININDLSNELGVGVPTVTDILNELQKPGRDPRGEFTSTEFDDNIQTIKDLKEGMELNGIVTNAIGNLSIAYMIFACGAVLVTICVSFINEYKFNKDHAAEQHTT